MKIRIILSLASSILASLSMDERSSISRRKRDLLHWNRTSNTMHKYSSIRTNRKNEDPTSKEDVNDYLNQLRKFYRLKNDKNSLLLLNQIKNFKKSD